MATKSNGAPLEAYWSAQEFAWNHARLIPEIEKAFKDAHPKRSEPSSQEVSSWHESTFWLASLLRNLNLGKVWMFIEYSATPTMSPIDVVLAGYHPDGRFSFAAIELKQWTALQHARTRSTRLQSLRGIYLQ